MNLGFCLTFILLFSIGNAQLFQRKLQRLFAINRMRISPSSSSPSSSSVSSKSVGGETSRTTLSRLLVTGSSSTLILPTTSLVDADKAMNGTNGLKQEWTSMLTTKSLVDTDKAMTMNVTNSLEQKRREITNINNDSKLSMEIVERKQNSVSMALLSNNSENSNVEMSLRNGQKIIIGDRNTEKNFSYGGNSTVKSMAVIVFCVIFTVSTFGSLVLLRKRMNNNDNDDNDDNVDDNNSNNDHDDNDNVNDDNNDDDYDNDDDYNNNEDDDNQDNNNGDDDYDNIELVEIQVVESEETLPKIQHYNLRSTSSHL